MQITINPERLYTWNAGSCDNELVLDSLLQSSASDGVWHSKQIYEYTCNNIRYKLNFTQSFIKRQRKEGKSGYKLSIFDTSKTPIGKGGYAVVYPIIATFIRYNEGQICPKNGRSKLVKIQDHSDKDQTQSILNEYDRLVQAGHIRVKKPIFSEHSKRKQSYLIIEQANGFTLEHILNPQKRSKITDKISRLSISKRLEITIAILNAIKSQVTERNLVHRDIKPGNIIIDLNQIPPKVVLIDFGFAMDKDQQDYRRLGTRAYRAPESFENKPIYTFMSDIYSAGRILSYLWGDDHQNYYIHRTKDYNYIKTKSSNEQLFSLPEIHLYLDELDQKTIKKCLMGMLAEQPLERPTLDEIITLFSTIDRERYKNEDASKYDISYLKEFERKTNPQIILIKKHLNIMRNKEQDLRNRKCIVAADVMLQLVRTITRNTEYLEGDLNPSVLLRYRKKCLSDIYGAKNTLTTHRDIYWILAETAMALSLLGVGYLIALGINYYLTGRLSFFAQTKSDQITESLKDIVLFDLSFA